MKTEYIILRPLVTEKTVGQQEKNGIWTFEVHEDATKIDVQNALWILYGRKVSSVRMSSLPKKTRLVGRGKVMTKRQHEKRAYVKFSENKPFEILDIQAPKKS